MPAEYPKTSFPPRRPRTPWTVSRDLFLLVLGLCSAWFGIRFAFAGAWPQGVILFSGNVQGYLDQCGCARNPLGGLDRRSSFIGGIKRKWPGAALLLLDSGNFADTPGPAGEIKTRGLVQVMNRLGYQAVGLGERELLYNPEFIKGLIDEAQFPFVSTNLVRSKERVPWVNPVVVLPAGNLKVAVFGVTRHNPNLRVPLQDGEAVVTLDPVQALNSYLSRFKVGRDLVVVLATMPPEDARLLARRVPGIDLILGSHPGRTMEPVVEGTTRILYAGDEGKYLAQIDLYRTTPGMRISLETRIAALSEVIVPDVAVTGQVVEILARAQEAERNHRTNAEQNGTDPQRTFVGSQACAPCHSSIVEEWRKTPHARAYQTLLEERRGTFQNSCIPCHVTGFNQQGGFIDQRTTPRLVGVGCESCHGPAAGHLAQPQNPYGKVTLGTCTSCHNSETDKDFNYYQDRQLVRHGSGEH